MGDNLSQGKQRTQFKCSYCRQSKVACKPRDRDWDGAQQKCDRCERHGLPCGPNAKKRNDPIVRNSSSGPLVGQEEGSSRQGTQQQAPERSIGHMSHNDYSPVPIDMNETGRGEHDLQMQAGQGKDRISAFSEEEVSTKADQKLSELHELGDILIYTSHHPSFLCRGTGIPDAYDERLNKLKPWVLERLHILFIYICDLGLLADERNHCHQARWIFLSLLSPLQQYPGFRDGRKRSALRKMALFYQKIGNLSHFQRILRMIAGIPGLPVHPSHQEDLNFLAISYSKTSDQMNCALTRLWQKYNIAADVPPKLTIPPLNLATQNREPFVASAIMALPNFQSSSTDLLDQQAIHIAARSGDLQTLKKLIDTLDSIDARDLHLRTPLSLAAANGHEPCCSALLSASADPNSRDAHGHTVLEIAASGGHLPIVRLLLDRQAELNDTLVDCASTPLQAAIESSNFSPELAKLLLDRGANFLVRRISDNKNAFDLARSKGMVTLVKMMREKYHYQQTVRSAPNH